MTSVKSDRYHDTLDSPQSMQHRSTNLVCGERMPRDVSDLLHGTLDVLVLKTLSWGPMHGYAIATWIEQRTDGTLEIVDAALYKALHRLEHSGAIAAEWGLSDNNRRAKYYSLTTHGRQMMRAETATWRRYVVAVSAILETA
jgi:PadR family transcriptional regulator, regulatory protein PadR